LKDFHSWLIGRFEGIGEFLHWVDPWSLVGVFVLGAARRSAARATSRHPWPRGVTCGAVKILDT
jgi:hypothetical protein